jgi:hypothetical protein
MSINFELNEKYDEILLDEGKDNVNEDRYGANFVFQVNANYGNNKYCQTFNSNKEEKNFTKESKSNFNSYGTNTFKKLYLIKKKSNADTAQTLNKIKEIKKKEVKFRVLPKKQWRFDMTKKFWKSKISAFGTDKINELIQKSEDLPEKLKNEITIHKPSSEFFTSIAKENSNFNFLEYNLRKIFTMGQDKTKKNDDKTKDNLQKKNDDSINQIFSHFKQIGYENLSENSKNIKEFFEMNYESLIKNFYDSKEFTTFCEDKKAKFFDEGTKQQEGFSLFKDYGLINVFKMGNRKRKRK